MATVKDTFGIADISREFGSVKYMKEAQALIIRDLVKEYDLSEFLEIGFFTVSLQFTWVRFCAK